MTKNDEEIDSKGMSFSSQVQKVQREGLYEEEEGKDIEYKHRVQGQEEIKNFVNKVFTTRTALNYDQYADLNLKVSSEMFCSLMSILHERLPCAPNFFRLKKIFRTKILPCKSPVSHIKMSHSPSRTIASPSMLTGLIKKGRFSIGEPMTPQVNGMVLSLSHIRKQSHVGGGGTPMSGYSSKIAP